MADDRIGAYAGIAPPISWSATGDIPDLPPDSALASFGARALLVCGTNDPFCKPRDLSALAARFSHGEARIFDGADHFFGTGRDEMVSLVASFLTGT